MHLRATNYASSSRHSRAQELPALGMARLGLANSLILVNHAANSAHVGLSLSFRG
jgi:hypothetical protein